MICFPIGIAIFLWISGYFMTARSMSTTGLHGEDLEKIISPPKWLYNLCGAPVSKNYPKGTMRVAAFGVQMGGVFLGIYMVWYVISRPPTLENAMGFGFCMLLSYLLSAYVSKRYPADFRPGNRKGRK